jgi:non-ribosomal peptide synthetase component E (peptide arylation enzyme)
VGKFLAGVGLARQKAPERIEPVDSLPRTASGKIRKDLLRSRIQSIVSAEQDRPAAAE